MGFVEARSRDLANGLTVVAERPLNRGHVPQRGIRRAADWNLPVVVWDRRPDEQLAGTMVPAYGTFHSAVRLKSGIDV